jgi:hypothetical protein
VPAPAPKPAELPTVRGVFDPFAADLGQALTAARLRRSVPPPVFALVGAILARLLAAEPTAPDRPE